MREDIIDRIVKEAEYIIEEKDAELSKMQEELANKEQENIVLQEKLANIANEAN